MLAESSYHRAISLVATWVVDQARNDPS